MKLNVGVLRGGPSHDYDLSLKTGAMVLRQMPEFYKAHDIFISKDGTWHREGLERSPERALAGVDVVFNALHGNYGEDGKVQQMLERLRMPYTGSNPAASALGMNKVLAKKILQNQGIRVPHYTVVRKDDDISEKVRFAFNNFLLPVIVKPAMGGTSIGVTIVKNFMNLEESLRTALEISDSALVEEFIKGKEVTTGIIRNFRNEPLYVLLPVEISHEQGREYYDRESKLNALSSHATSSGLTDNEKITIQKLARDMHQALDLGHYSRIDMMIHPRRGIFVLEANTQPTFIPGSSFHHALESVGSTPQEFIDHVLIQAMAS